MFGPMAVGGLQKTTSYKVVLPFYVYASVSLVVAAVMLFLNTDIFAQHHFSPHTLAVTHIMALGWGTMIIFGASHQLLPVIIEGELESNLLAYLTFIFTGIGIPMVIYGFYTFNLGWILQAGAVLVNLGVICYLVNVFTGIFESKKVNVHAMFVGAAAFWLFSTTFFGLLLAFNFTLHLLPSDSVSYLTIHAHMGIVGWFLLLVLGVGSRLIPMFLISKYTNNKKLWQILILINAGLISFIVFWAMGLPQFTYYISLALVLVPIAMFVQYCKMAHKVRLRKAVDEQMKISLLSVVQMLLPIIVLVVVLLLLPQQNSENISLLYGFTIFFGWLTAIILGMTFKTMPFIVWNKVYHKKAHGGKTPVPKELFKENIFNQMSVAYIAGFLITILGIVIQNDLTLKIGTFLLLLAAVLYVINTTIILFHKAKIQ
ncbi:MAG TPA: cytochrome C oxidase subunit I [Edaphocola sp.]|nr:cytochrome C oxidase subunit I [Edaphocola sp.]